MQMPSTLLNPSTLSHKTIAVSFPHGIVYLPPLPDLSASLPHPLRPLHLPLPPPIDLRRCPRRLWPINAPPPLLLQDLPHHPLLPFLLFFLNPFGSLAQSLLRLPVCFLLARSIALLDEFVQLDPLLCGLE